MDIDADPKLDQGVLSPQSELHLIAHIPQKSSQFRIVCTFILILILWSRGMKEKWKVLFVVLAVLTTINSKGRADNPAIWNFSLETTGNDVSWTSTTLVNPAFEAYDCNYALTQVKVNVNGVWRDLRNPHYDANNGGSTYHGLPVRAYTYYDTNDVNATFSVSADANGVGHASITGVQFGHDDITGLPVTGLKISGTIHVLGMKRKWKDSFDTYGVQKSLNSSGQPWAATWEEYNTQAPGYDPLDPLTGNVKSMWAGSRWGNRAHYQCDFYADSRHSAKLNDASVLALFDPNHVRFKVDAWDEQRNQDNVWNSWWLVGRYTNSSKLVAVGAVYGQFNALYTYDDGRRALYAKLIDYTNGTNPPVGYDSNDHFVAFVDPQKPITLELNFDVNNVTARVSHNGGAATISFKTTVRFGKPAMGGWNEWAYAYGQFDDFEIYDNRPYTPANCNDSLSYHLKADINKDCKVDFKDFALFAEGWSKCTDPTDSNCL